MSQSVIPEVQRWAIAWHERERAHQAVSAAQKVLDLERTLALRALQSADVKPRQVMEVTLLGGLQLGVFYDEAGMAVAWEGTKPQ